MKTTFAKLLLLAMLLGGIALPAFAQTDDKTEQNPPVVDLSRLPPVQADKRAEIVAIQQKLIAEGYDTEEGLNLLLDYAVWLHVFGEATEARDELINEIVDVFRFNIGDTPPSGYEDFRLDPAPYEAGDDGYIIYLMRVVSISDYLVGQYYELPCVPLRARIALISATGPYFGSSRDSFLPRSECNFFPKVEKYALNLWNCCIGGEQPYAGTIIHARRKNYYKKYKRAPFAWLERKPSQEFLDLYPQGTPLPAISATSILRNWSYLSPDNRDTYLERIVPEHRLAVQEVVLAYAQAYRGEFGPRDALYRELAVDALSVIGAHQDRCDMYIPVVRKAVVEGADAKVVRQLLEGGALENRPLMRDSSQLSYFDACLEIAGLDPVIFFAVDDVAMLEVFLGFGPKAGAWGPTFSPNAVNAYNKTVFMVAAQRNRLESAKLLLAYGADVAARTHQRREEASDEKYRDYHSAYTSIYHKQRTALMYAAANASLPLIDLLIDRGADVCTTDSEGKRAKDYFEGFYVKSASAYSRRWEIDANPVVKDRARALEVLSDANCKDES